MTGSRESRATFYVDDIEARCLDGLSRPLLREWEALRGARPCPDWREFDIVRHPRAAGRLVVYEHDPDGGTYRCRLFGQELCGLYSLDLTGKSIDAYPESLVETVRSQLDRVRLSASPLLARFPLVDLGTMAAAPYWIEKLLLPYSFNGETARIALSVNTLFQQRRSGPVAMVG